MPCHWNPPEQRTPDCGLRALAFAALCFSVLWPLSVFAQVTSEPKPASSDKPADSSSPTNGSTKKSGVQPTADDVIRLLGPDGQPWVIPHWPQWDEYQKWVKSREAN